MYIWEHYKTISQILTTMKSFVNSYIDMYRYYNMYKVYFVSKSQIHI